MPDDQTADAPLTSELTMGESVMTEQAPSTDAPPADGGETPAAPNNETESEPVESSTATQDDVKAFVPGGMKARKLGEARKKLAATLISSARENPDVREKLKELVSTEPDLAKYLQKNWKRDFQEIILEEEVSDEPQETAESLKAKLQAEILVEQLKEDKRDDADDLASKLKFSQDEADALYEHALSLEGKKLGGKEIDFDEALTRAAYSIRPDKARIGLTSLPSGMPSGELPDKMAKASEREGLATMAKKLRGGNKKDIIENLKIVDKQLKGNLFTFPTDEE